MEVNLPVDMLTFSAPFLRAVSTKNTPYITVTEHSEGFDLRTHGENDSLRIYFRSQSLKGSEEIHVHRDFLKVLKDINPYCPLYFADGKLHAIHKKEGLPRLELPVDTIEENVSPTPISQDNERFNYSTNLAQKLKEVLPFVRKEWDEYTPFGKSTTGINLNFKNGERLFLEATTGQALIRTPVENDYRIREEENFILYNTKFFNLRQLSSKKNEMQQWRIFRDGDKFFLEYFTTLYDSKPRCGYSISYTTEVFRENYPDCMQLISSFIPSFKITFDRDYIERLSTIANCKKTTTDKIVLKAATGMEILTEAPKTRKRFFSSKRDLVDNKPECYENWILGIEGVEIDVKNLFLALQYSNELSVATDFKALFTHKDDTAILIGSRPSL